MFLIGKKEKRMAESQREKHNRILRSLGLFRHGAAMKSGIPSSSLLWLLRNGDIKKIGPDVYHHEDIAIDSDEEEFAAACLLFGDQATIGGATALFYYNLIEQDPSQTWLLVPPSVTSYNKGGI